MDPVQLLKVEVQGFLVLLCAMFAYRMLTREMSLSGLLCAKPGSNAVSPERVQLLLATMAISAQFLGQVIHGNGTSLPDVNAQWLAMYGSSSGIYAAVKAGRMWLGKKI